MSLDSDRERALEIAPELREIAPRLSIYSDLLRRWQRRINLVGPSTIDAIWTRHFADSIQVVSFAPLDAVWADLGSGAGFPGMVVSLLQAERRHGSVHLIESDARKAAFLREVSRETGSSAVVHSARCEDVLPHLAPGVITSRAMTDMSQLIGMSMAHVEKGAIGVFLKGRDVASELTALTTDSRLKVKLAPSRTDSASSVVVVCATVST